MTAIVEELRKKGLTLAQIAHETGKSIGWISTKTSIRRVKGVDGEGSLSDKGALLKKLKVLEEKGIRIKERQAKREDINLPLNRTPEELEEYRKKRDAEQLEEMKGLDVPLEDFV